MAQVFKNGRCIGVFLGVLLLTSCSKENHSGSDNTGKAKFILGSWVLQNSETKEQYGFWEIESWLECEKDNPYTFTESGRFSVSEGPTKCNTNDPEVNDAGNWRLEEEETVLSVK